MTVARSYYKGSPASEVMPDDLFSISYLNGRMPCVIMLFPFVTVLFLDLLYHRGPLSPTCFNHQGLTDLLR